MNMNRTGAVAGTIGGASSPASTINERMDRVANHLTAACQRVESVLSKVNGTPPAPGQDAAKVSGISPLVNCLEQIEGQAERLHRLAEGLEQIA